MVGIAQGDRAGRDPSSSIRDPAQSAGIGQWGAIQAVAPSIRVLVSPINVRDASELERDVAAFAHGSNSGLIVTSSPLATLHRDVIVALAARHRLPAVYYNRGFVTAGGLISYGPDFVDQYRRAAGLRRSHPQRREASRPAGAGADQVRTVINLKTAKALGLKVPPSVLARADEVIE